MAVDPSDDHDRLPCGNSVDALLRHLTSGEPTPHESACEYCREQAEELRPLVSEVRRTGHKAVSAPPGVLAGGMRAVRAGRRRGGA
ncbi:hypothetical protein Q7689_13905, partial [Nocardiopsis tropica]|nr:hypothetical protein [Nocardiopsis tropica]